MGTAILWALIALAYAVRIAGDWPLADNHLYLLTYWMLAVALGLSARDGLPRSLAVSSRTLVGAAFACAVIWKAVLAPDFLDGRFFRVTLMTDPRFGDAAVLLGGLTRTELEANRSALTPLPAGAELDDPPVVVEPPRFRFVALASTWAILALEAVIAVAMLVSTSSRAVVMLRHGSLLMFCLVSYAFAPVAGFGWLLLILGCVQCGPSERRLQAVYVAAFLLVLFYAEVPWAGLLLGQESG